MLGTVWFDRAYNVHFVIVRQTGDGVDGKLIWDDMNAWDCLVLDGENAGNMVTVYDFELKHGRYEKVG